MIRFKIVPFAEANGKHWQQEGRHLEMCIRDRSNAPTNGLVVWLDAISMFQLNADAQMNGNTIVPASREVNGIDVYKRQGFITAGNLTLR